MRTACKAFHDRVDDDVRQDSFGRALKACCVLAAKSPPTAEQWASLESGLASVSGTELTGTITLSLMAFADGYMRLSTCEGMSVSNMATLISVMFFAHDIGRMRCLRSSTGRVGGQRVADAIHKSW